MTEQNQNKNHKDAGNALVYVLIAIALFASLTFFLGRQTDSNEAHNLTDERARLFASQLISYAATVRSAIEQMEFSGVQLGDLDYSTPGTVGFTGGVENYKKVYHPEGGGMIPKALPDNVISESTTDPPANWYLGSFNNVEWTNSTAQDIMLSAFQISRAACEQLNDIIVGDTTIPVVPNPIEGFFVDAGLHSQANTDLEISDCAACEGHLSLCVSNAAETIFVYYNVTYSR